MSPGLLVILNLMGGISLLLWGVRMVKTGVQRAWGDQLDHFIEHNLTGRIPAFGAGLAATLIVQSGTATALILTGLAAKTAIEGARGLALLLGADLGSALIASLFASTGTSLSVVLAPLFIFTGYMLFTWAEEFRPKNAGRIILGLGMLFLALRLVVAASAPLREATLFHMVLTTIAAEPALGFLLGAAVTWLSYSSLAVVLLVASFLASQSLDMAGAVAIVLGVNLGAGLPALSGSAAQPPQARRLPLANFIARATAALLLLGFSRPIAALLEGMPIDSVHRMVSLHVGFNLFVALLCLPLVGPVMRLAARVMPDARVQEDPLETPRFLDRSTLASPGVALRNAALETVRMAELLERMLKHAMSAFKASSLEMLKQVRVTDAQLNRYHREIHDYLDGISQLDMDSVEGRKALEVMLYVSNLEHAGDLIELSLSDRIRAKVKENVEFTHQERNCIHALVAIVKASLKLASGIISSGDVEGARQLILQKNKFRIIENKIIDGHFRESGERGPKVLRRRALFIDMVRDLHTIHSHVTSAAYPIVDAAGLLRESRLKPVKTTKTAKPAKGRKAAQARGKRK